MSSKRSQATGRGRFLLSVFVVAWLNLAVQPCVMAMELAPEPAAVTEQSAHAGHSNHSSDHDCDHCPPASGGHAITCASAAASDCSSISDLNYDKRNGTPKLNDIPTYVAIAELATPFEITIPTSSPPLPGCAPLDYPSEPPPSIRFCVFLK